jgi:four helix bundle protein
MGEIQSYRDLRVWQAGMDLVERVYRLSAEFPPRETYGLAGQMRRAAISIPSNIAEGHTRENTREYLYLLSVAQGSLAELQTQIEIAGRLGYLALDQVSPALDQTVALAKQLYSLRNALQKREYP